MSNANADDAAASPPIGIFMRLTAGRPLVFNFEFRPAPCLDTMPVSFEMELPGAGSYEISIGKYLVSGRSSSDQNHDRTPEFGEGSTAPDSVPKGHQACLSLSALNSPTEERINYSDTPTSSHEEAPQFPTDLTPSRNQPPSTIADSVRDLSESPSASPSAPPSAPQSGRKRKNEELDEEMGGKSGYEPKSKR
jgi:hypothetical protein